MGKNNVPGLMPSGRINPTKIQTRRDLRETLLYFQQFFSENDGYELTFDETSTIFTNKGNGESNKVTIPPGGFKGPCPAEFLRHKILPAYNKIRNSGDGSDHEHEYPLAGEMIDITRIKGYESFSETSLKILGYGLIRGFEPDTYAFFQNPNGEDIPIHIDLLMSMLEDNHRY